MLSACAPGIGYLTNPIADSGQDQDPSNETIVGEACLFKGKDGRSTQGAMKPHLSGKHRISNVTGEPKGPPVAPKKETKQAILVGHTVPCVPSHMPKNEQVPPKYENGEAVVKPATLSTVAVTAPVAAAPAVASLGEDGDPPASMVAALPLHQPQLQRMALGLLLLEAP